jgi:hypothetical protein
MRDGYRAAGPVLARLPLGSTLSGATAPTSGRKTDSARTSLRVEEPTTKPDRTAAT